MTITYTIYPAYPQFVVVALPPTAMEYDDEVHEVYYSADRHWLGRGAPKIATIFGYISKALHKTRRRVVVRGETMADVGSLEEALSFVAGATKEQERGK